jgi:hypothetical protein
MVFSGMLKGLLRWAEDKASRTALGRPTGADAVAP